MNKDWNLHDLFERGIASGQITFWTAIVREVIPRHTGRERVLEYAAWDAGFLRTLCSMRPFAEGVAASADPKFHEAVATAVRPDEPIRAVRPEDLEQLSGHFDVAFSNESFSFEPDLRKAARDIHRALRDGGEYYATFGSHIENPLWPHRRRLLREEGNSVYDYSLEEVADAFFEEGFEVGVKRLPVDYFNIYEPAFTRRRALGLSLLVETTYEHKMLFYFRRDDELARERRK